MKQAAQSWVQISRDSDTQIEAIRAHFTGHAYDPHWHDSYLVGVTEQGVQQFHSRRQKHQSRPGNVFLLEPGELHDGDAIDDRGFTYRMLYIDPALMQQQLGDLYSHLPQHFELNFAATLTQDTQLAHATFDAYQALQDNEPKMVKEAALQDLFAALTRHHHWQQARSASPADSLLAQQARDYLHSCFTENIGLSEMAAALGVDRFRLSREFQARYGLPPHAWLIQLRLTEARRLLASGIAPVAVAARLGFADQSHLGRWFKRAYQLTPAHYQRHCSTSL
ncbi:AraC-like DNA-binding protein [Erwinia toletana]|uniref:AraC-like DNA-binding protein n=1 Tax=Winslowiella toletana TaxID=92490 RepID=A0ABS4PE11_9GAMM|nr:AraC family transcriptional regulator [Winslowiella toletana]MBP2170874.1 AraC-like DNA-binding protein [Winslowiella toletana]